jgi:hypothetical protein
LEKNGGATSLKKRLLCTLAALSIFMLIVASAGNVAAADYTKVGVKPGDTATYRSSFTTLDDNKTDFLVWGVVGTLVYLNITNYHPNGAVDSRTQFPIDVYIGGLGSVYLIAGGLSANDEIYHGSRGAGYWINDTSTMAVAGISRTVNHLRTPDGQFEVWWDKETGLMVKANLFNLYWFNYTMMSTTTFAAPPSLFSNPMTLLALGEGGVILILLAYIAVSRRGGKGRK